MNSADETAAPNQPTDAAPKVSVPEGMDLEAINEAIVESANEAAKDPQNTFDVEDISLDNTPTTDAELEAQKAKDPSMSLAGTPATNETPIDLSESATTPAPTAPVEKPAETAGFVDGDLMDDPEAPVTPEAKPDYDAIKADPVESFDENAAPAPVEAPEEKPADTVPATDAKDEKPKTVKAPKKSIDFNAILHNNVAVAGIVAGGIVLVIIIILIITLAS